MTNTPELSNQLPAHLEGLSEKWLTEQWLMAAGVVPEQSADTLLMYAYAQSGVAKVTLEIDRDDAHKGESPCVTYKIKLDPVTLLKWKAVRKLKKETSSGILQKAALLLCAKAGSPISMEENIQSLAREYLPAQYRVEVQIVE